MARFVNEKHYRHGTSERVGVLLTNLGTPASPTPRDVRRYLGEFLADPRVVEVPRPIWRLILHGVILRTRPARSAEAYEKVWTESGSPLLNIATRQRDALAPLLEKRVGAHCEVALAMRYGEPSIEAVLDELRRKNVRRILLLPLYPQYSATTTASTFDEVTRVLRRWRWLPELRTVNQYHDREGYVGALWQSVTRFWTANGHGDRLLFSFHGIPHRNLLAGDPYHCQCQKTARLVAGRLGLGDEQWAISFQSRLGRAKWLQPYTDKVLKKWAKAGVKRVDVVCPGFSADCLETLEEVAIGYRELFLSEGGGELHYIPALNTDDAHIEFLAALAAQHMTDWTRTEHRLDPQLSRERALALGAKE